MVHNLKKLFKVENKIVIGWNLKNCEKGLGLRVYGLGLGVSEKKERTSRILS